MNKERVKGWLGLIGALLILSYSGSVYRIDGFSAAFGMALFSAMIAIPALLLSAYRRVGSLPAWLAMAAAFPVLAYAANDAATAILAWAFCCGTPLAVTLFWPYCKRIRPLTERALPLAGAFWLGGTLLYAKLHFGSWALSSVTLRFAERYGVMVDQMEVLYGQIYGEQLPEQLGEMFTLMKSQSFEMGFYFVTMIAFALFGLYFLAVFAADRSVPPSARWLGSWATLIPGRGISWLFMGLYVMVQLMDGVHFRTMLAVLNLFGFFFVFTALHRLLQFFRKRDWHPAAQVLLIGLLLVLSYCSAGGALLTAYTILMYVGWWIATLPKNNLKKPS